MTVLIVLLAVLAIALLAWALLRAVVGPITIYEYQRGLRYDRGRFSSVLGPGRYWIVRSSTRVDVVDVRPTVVTVPGQEVITADGVSLRVSLAADYAIVDPAVAMNEVEDFRSALYVALQVGLRGVVGSAAVDDLLERRSELGPEVMAATAEEASRMGLELRRVELKDLMFPGDLKRTFAQVVAARKEGLAALEKARGETAALRNLGNAARLVGDNPALLQLRLLQQIAASAGNTIVLGMPSSSTPLPLRAGEPAAEVEPPEPPEPR